MHRLLLIGCIIFYAGIGRSQNPKIKCYFNHPVNNSVSAGTNAVCLNTAFADTLVAYINRAQQSIDLCIYNYYLTPGDGMDVIATAINNAYNRGVVIRWIGNGSSSNNGWANLNTNIKKLSSPTTQGYGICHNKFIVFDANSSDAVVWTGSFNLTRQQNNYDYNNLLIIQDQPVAMAYYNEFNKMWGGAGISPNLSSSKFGINKTPSAVNTFTVNGTLVEVYFSPRDGAATHLKNAINTANSELFAGIYTFTDTSISNAVKASINQGRSVKMIMDQYSNTYPPYSVLNPLLGSNLKIYSNNTYLYHNKILLVDPLHTTSDPQVCTGSFNWSASADTKNDENLVIIHDAVLANEYYQSLCKNFTDVGGTVCPMVGIEDFDSGLQQMAVYPNPANQIITVKVKNAGEALCALLLDPIGNIIRTNTVVQKDELSMDVSNLPAGLYFVQVFRGDKIITSRLVKQ
jgi:hypothetical protein